MKDCFFSSSCRRRRRSRSRRLPPANNLPGGWHGMNVADKDVLEMAAFAAQEIGLELQEIMAAQSQVC